MKPALSASIRLIWWIPRWGNTYDHVLQHPGSWRLHPTLCSYPFLCVQEQSWNLGNLNSWPQLPSLQCFSTNHSSRPALLFLGHWKYELGRGKDNKARQERWYLDHRRPKQGEIWNWRCKGFDKTWVRKQSVEPLTKSPTWRLCSYQHTYAYQVDEDPLWWKTNCLLRYRVYSEGEFLLRSPKRMTGTEDFLDLEQNSERSDCHRERQETCQIRKFAEKGFENCACRPWGLLSALPSEVWATSWNIKLS